MVGEWTLSFLREVSVNHDALRVPVKEADRKPGPYPYYGASGVVDHVNGYLFEGEYLLVAEDGENLRTRQTPLAFMASGRFWVNNHAHILTGNSKALTRFLHYALAAADIQPFLTGAVMPKLTQFNLNQIPILLPSLREQREIVEVLGSLDDKIELNRRMAETLEAMARSLFKSWFVDFDPVHEKAAARSNSLPNELVSIFPDDICDDGLPQGWEQKALQSGLASSIVRGISPSYADEGVFVLNQKCIRDGRIDTSKARRHDPASKRIGDERLLAPGDVVINSTGVGTLGRVAQLRRQSEPITADSHVTIVKPNEKEISSNLFGLAMINLEPLIETLGRGSTGQTELSRESVAELRVVTAPRPVLRAFDDAVVPLRDRADHARAEALSLEQLRDTLLPKLISGDLRVGEAEKKVSAA